MIQEILGSNRGQTIYTPSFILNAHMHKNATYYIRYQNVPLHLNFKRSQLHSGYIWIVILIHDSRTTSSSPSSHLTTP